MRYSTVAAVGLVATVLCSPLFAQTARILSTKRPHVIRSGAWHNHSAADVVVFETILSHSDAPWIRIHFGRTACRCASRARIRYSTPAEASVASQTFSGRAIHALSWGATC